MGFLFRTGAELQSSTSGVELDALYGTTIDTVTVHGGAASYKMSGSIINGGVAGWDHIFAPTAVTKAYRRDYFNIAALDNNPSVAFYMDLLNSGTGAFSIQINNSGGVYTCTPFYNNFAANLSSFVISSPTNTWHMIEVFYDTTPADGSEVLTVKLDGVTVSTASNLTFTQKTVNQISAGIYNGSGATITGSTVYMDDIGINDATGSAQNSYLGEGKIVHLYPNGAGDNNSWQTSAGGAGSSTNYQAVDEVTPDDATTYLKRIATTIKVDDYNIFDPSTAGIGASDTISVVAVGVRGGAISATASTDRDILLRLKSAASGTVVKSGSSTNRMNVNGWVTHTTNAAKTYQLISYTDPTTGIAWTPTGTNSLANAQIGVENQTSVTTEVRVTDLWLMVEYVPAAATTTSTSSSISTSTSSTSASTSTSSTSASTSTSSTSSSRSTSTSSTSASTSTSSTSSSISTSSTSSSISTSSTSSSISTSSTSSSISTSSTSTSKSTSTSSTSQSTSTSSTSSSISTSTSTTSQSTSTSSTSTSVSTSTSSTSSSISTSSTSSSISTSSTSASTSTSSTSTSRSTSTSSTSTSLSTSTSSTSASTSTSSTSTSVSTSTTSVSTSTSSTSTSTTTLPLFQYLQDNFNDNSLDPVKWDATVNGGSTVTEASQQLTLTTGANSSFAELTSHITWILTGSYVYFELKSLSTGHPDWDLIAGAYTSDFSKALLWDFNNGLLRAWVSNGGVTTVASATYDPVQHRFLKIYESGGTIFWATSPDGLPGNYTTFGSIATPFTLGSMFWDYDNITASSVGAKTAVIDNFNIGPDATTTSTSSTSSSTSTSTSSTSASTSTSSTSASTSTSSTSTSRSTSTSSTSVSTSTSSTSTSISTSTSSTSQSTSLSTSSTSTSVSVTTSTSSTSASTSTSSTSASTSMSTSLSTSTSSTSASTSRSTSTSSTSTSKSTSTSSTSASTSTSTSTTSQSTSTSTTTAPPTTTSTSSTSTSTTSTSTSTTTVLTDYNTKPRAHIPVASMRFGLIGDSRLRAIKRIGRY